MIVFAEADVKTVPSVTHASNGILTGRGATTNPYAAVVATRTVNKDIHDSLRKQRQSRRTSEILL